jgi:DNA polymerase-3 subunit epsilon
MIHKCIQFGPFGPVSDPVGYKASTTQTAQPYSFDGMTRRLGRSAESDLRRRQISSDEVVVPPLVSIERPASPLIDRARSFLEAGPSGSVPLIEHVCSLPGAPAAVAEQLALALFNDIADVQRDQDGRWLLVRERRSAPTNMVASRRLDALTYVVVDVETTGGSPGGGDRIVEFGAVTVAGGRIVDHYETLVNPERPISPQVTRLTRITWDMVRRAPTIRDLAARIADVLRGHLFVAHNASFDWRFVSAELSRFGGQHLVGEKLCTVKLARAVVPNIKRRSLGSLSYYYGIENHARHRAGGDALATAKLLIRLLAAAQDRGCETLEDLRALIRNVPSRGRGRRKRRGMPGWADGEMTA